MSASNVDILIRTIGAPEAARLVSSVSSAVSSIGNAWRAAGQIAAAAGVLDLLRDSWRAAEEARVAHFQLAAALQSTGDASASTLQALKDQAGALQSLTGVGDETILSVQRLLLSLGGTTHQVEQLTPVVLDVAAAMGVDALTAARQLGEAFKGQEVSIDRLNIKAKSFEELMGALGSRFSGQAAALAQAKGPLAAMAIQWDELKEKIGSLTNWTASPIVGELNKIADALSRVISIEPSAGLMSLLNFLVQNEPTVANLRAITAAANNFANFATGAAAFGGVLSNPSSLLPAASPAGPRQTGGGFGGFDAEEASIEGERARQAAAARDLLQVEANLNNQYAYRRQLIDQDPTLSLSERNRALTALMQDQIPVLQQREDLLRAEFERQRQTDPGLTLETTIEAESRLVDAMGERSRVTKELEAMESGQTFNGQLKARIDQLTEAYGNLSVAMANVAVDTIMAGFQGLAGALTSIITGAKSAGQAFAEFGMTMLTNFIQTVLTAVLYAKVALPILSALGVASGGASFAGGTGVVGAGLAFGLAAGTKAASGGREMASGGYTGDGPIFEPAATVHRGEWVVPAWRTAEIGVPVLESMTFGDAGPSGDSGASSRIIIVDSRRDADRLARDPRFRSVIIDLVEERLG